MRSWRLSRVAAPVLALLLAAAAPATAAPDAASEPWSAAQTIRDRLFAARADALLHPERAVRRARAAARGLSGPLRRGLAEHARSDLRELKTVLADAERAAASHDPVALATASGSALAALRRGAFKVTVAETRVGRVRAARDWLLVRDFREATRFTRAAVDATVALDDLQAGEIGSRAAVVAVRKDLLDAYQARLRSYLDDARLESERGYLPAAAESAALAAGYWRVLAPVYEHQRGVPARAEVDAAFERLTPLVRRPATFRQALEDAGALLKHFRAAPLTADEKARRATQLIRFLDLVPVEYDHGTDDGHVTIAFELQEALAFADGADSALTDLAPALETRDPRALAGLEASVARLTRLASDAHERRNVAPLEDVEAEREHADELIEASFPEEWREPSDEADFDLIQISLDQMEAAVSAGQSRLAEQARLAAYAFFEFGPEIKLSAFDPGLVTEVEGLIWYGARDRPGLAELIADGREPSEVRETRLVLNEALEEAKATTGEGASTGTVVTNAALIVFREGLEAILIIAAITASMVGVNRPLRRPVLRGALLALPASAVLFVVAELVLESLSRYGEKLEAVVGLVAIGVLLLVLNWFFHRVYWTEWIAGHRKRGKALLATGGAHRRHDGRPLPGGLHERVPRGLRDRALPAGAPAQLGHRHRAGGRVARAARHRAGRHRHLRARAAPALQAHARRDRRADRPRPVRARGQHDAHAPGRRLARDHADRRRAAAVDGHLARRLPDRRDARGPVRFACVRDRQLLRRRAGAQAPARPPHAPRGATGGRQRRLAERRVSR